MKKNRKQKGFTLIELLVVIAIIAILAVVVVLTLNPAELLRQARDSNRVSDFATMKSALSLYATDVSTSTWMGGGTSTSTIYTSGPTTITAPIATSTTANCVTSTPGVGNWGFWGNEPSITPTTTASGARAVETEPDGFLSTSPRLAQGRRLVLYRWIRSTIHRIPICMLVRRPHISSLPKQKVQSTVKEVPVMSIQPTEEIPHVL